MKRMKKIALIIATVMLMAVCFIFGASAESFEEGIFTYEVENEKATIIGINGTDNGKLIVPDTLGGYEVVAIERGVFRSAITEFSVSEENRYFSVDEFGVLFNKDKTELIAYPVANTRKTYKIPESVEVIWNRSFREVLFLRDIELPENLKEVEEYAFYSGVIFFEELYFYDKVEKIGEAAFYSLPFLKKIYVEGMTTEINGERPLGFRELYIKDGVDRDEFADKYIEYCLTGNEELLVELENCLEFPEESYYVGTIYCHSGSTAEAYAIAHEMDYELIHFFKGDWTYDYENMIRTRKCIHCDELETEPLESTNNGDVEIIEPVDPDTDFEVDKIEGDNFLLIEEKVTNGIEGNV